MHSFASWYVWCTWTSHAYAIRLLQSHNKGNTSGGKLEFSLVNQAKTIIESILRWMNLTLKSQANLSPWWTTPSSTTLLDVMQIQRKTQYPSSKAISQKTSYPCNSRIVYRIAICVELYKWFSWSSPCNWLIHLTLQVKCKGKECKCLSHQKWHVANSSLEINLLKNAPSPGGCC